MLVFWGVLFNLDFPKDLVFHQVSLCARFHGTVAGIKRDALTIVDPYKTSAMRLCHYP